MVKPEDKNATPFIQDYKEYHTGAQQLEGRIGVKKLLGCLQ